MSGSLNAGHFIALGTTMPPLVCGFTLIAIVSNTIKGKKKWNILILQIVIILQLLFFQKPNKFR